MGFRRDEIRVEFEPDTVGAVICGRCGYSNGIEPDEKFAADERLGCGGCGTDLGTWGEEHKKLYGAATTLLAATLRKP